MEQLCKDRRHTPLSDPQEAKKHRRAVEGGVVRGSRNSRTKGNQMGHISAPRSVVARNASVSKGNVRKNLGTSSQDHDLIE